jgi:hypothetical protein
VLACAALLIVGCRSDRSRGQGPPAADMTRYTNTRDGLTGNLAKHYVDFTLDYPTSWKLMPRKGNPNNFVDVSEFGKSEDELLEALGVGHIHRQLGKQLPSYWQISQGPTTVAGHSGYEFRFRFVMPKINKKAWGRAVFLPNLDGERGVTFTMIGTELDPQIRRIDDIGVKGDLPKILDTFRVGKR